MPDRRAFLASGLSLAALSVLARPAVAQTPALRGTIDAALPAERFGVRPAATDEQTRQLQRALDEAARAGRPLFLPAGRYEAGGLVLPNGTHLVGMPGQTRIVLRAGAQIRTADGATQVSLTNLVIDGEKRPLAAGARGLVQARGCRDLTIDGVDILNTGGSAIVLESCGGRVIRSTIADAKETGLHALDSVGLLIEGNTVREIGNNGIRVWRSAPGDDGTIVRANRIEKVRWDGGGNGQNGNGVNVFRAGGVIVAQNTMRDCAFSAVRVNNGANAQIAANTAQTMGEVAIFVEFGARGVTVTGNTVDGTAAGISVTNFDEDGRLGTVQGNVVRNLTPRSAVNPDTGPFGIAVEADCAVTGNVVEDTPGYGLLLGWGPYLRNVTATGNVVRRADIGIGISVAPGAGTALVSDNLVAETRRAAIAGMEWRRIALPDLSARDGTHRNVTVARNRAA